MAALSFINQKDDDFNIANHDDLPNFETIDVLKKITQLHLLLYHFTV